MSYHFDFGVLLNYAPMLAHGVLITTELTLVGGGLGCALAVLCAWARTDGPAWLRRPIGVYVEVIRNTPFIIQLFFLFFGLPSTGLNCRRYRRRCWRW